MLIVDPPLPQVVLTLIQAQFLTFEANHSGTEPLLVLFQIWSKRASVIVFDADLR